jgi:hypothetical protein
VETKLPTDLNGVIYTKFRRRRRDDPRHTMGPAAFKLQTAIHQSMANPDDSQLAKEKSLRSNVVQFAQILDERGFIPDLIVGVARAGLPAAGVLAQELGDDPPYPPFRFFRMTNSATISTRMPSRGRRSRASQIGRSTSSSLTTSASPGGLSKPRAPTWLAVSESMTSRSAPQQ